MDARQAATLTSPRPDVRRRGCCSLRRSRRGVVVRSPVAAPLEFLQRSKGSGSQGLRGSCAAQQVGDGDQAVGCGSDSSMASATAPKSMLAVCAGKRYPPSVVDTTRLLRPVVWLGWMFSACRIAHRDDGVPLAPPDRFSARSSSTSSPMS